MKMRPAHSAIVGLALVLAACAPTADGVADPDPEPAEVPATTSTMPAEEATPDRALDPDLDDGGPGDSNLESAGASDESEAQSSGDDAPDRALPEDGPEQVGEADTQAAVGEVPASLLAMVVEAAAESAGADPDALSVVRAEAVEWADGSLGCPEPGVAYTQVPVPGYWVELGHGDSMYDYRIAEDGYYVRCTAGGLPVTPPSA